MLISQNIMIQLYLNLKNLTARYNTLVMNVEFEDIR